MKARRQKEKQTLSAKALLTLIRNEIYTIKDPEKKPQGLRPKISIQDCLLAALAVFSMKFPSLLQFDCKRSEQKIAHNLKSLYGVKNAPCDTSMRSRLDHVDPRDLRKSYKSIFAALQRGKELEEYRFLNKYYLLACDGTEFFCSHKVHCNNCCRRNHRGGGHSYYHQMLAGVLVHPDHKEVFPFCPEPITQNDGKKKNDSEKKAVGRFLEHFRREHPHLSTIVVEDALHSNAPHIKQLHSLNIRFIIGVKPKGNKALFSWVKAIPQTTCTVKSGGSHYRFSFVNQVPLNDSHPDQKVNFFECWETTEKGLERHFSWITDIEVTKDNIYTLSRGARARWRIENETFNTLKNQGYQFEHNFGHGYNNLSNVFALLMMLAFLIDQVQQRSCGLFQAAWKKCMTKINLWTLMRNLFTSYLILSWHDLFMALSRGFEAAKLQPDTS